MDWEKEVVALLDMLVSIPSVNPGELECDDPIYGEREVGNALLSYLKEHFPMMRSWKEVVLPERYNVYATYTAEKDAPTILLVSHLDTVGVIDMTIEPFQLQRDGDRLFGRGANDAKGQIVAMLIGLKKAFQLNDGSLPVNVIFAAFVDEEHRHRGVDYFAKQSFSADLAIVGEPTELQFGAFHKGSIRFEVSATGKSTHSSTPWEGENAIQMMAEVISILQGEVREQVELIEDPLCGRSAISVTLIDGGTQVNIIPDHCSIHVDRRLNPGEDWHDALTSIKETVKKRLPNGVWEKITWHTPYLIDPPLANDLSRQGLQVLKEIMLKRDPKFQYVGLGYGCDASKIEPLNIPTVVFGPGSINQAHTSDEWILLSELLEAVDIYYDILIHFARGER